MANQFPHLPGMTVSINDGNLRLERAAAGQKITILGVTTANIPINEPILLSDGSTGRSALFHPATGAFSSKPSELNALLAETAKGVAIEYVKIAHGWGDEGFLYINEPDFNGHILTDQERYIALQESFDVLLNHNMDAVFCGGIFVDRKPDLSEIMEEDGVTPVYGSTDGDFAYQLADFCNLSTEENHSVLSAIGIMPLRVKQFRESVDEAYYANLGIEQVIVTSVVNSTKTVTLANDSSSSSGPLSSKKPFHGSSILIHYPTGSRWYTVDEFDGIDEITLVESPLESATPLNAAMQTFDGDYDSALTELLQEQYRLAFRGYHPTDTLSTDKPTLYEFNQYYNDAKNFVGNSNADGITAAPGELLPTYYRWFKMVGGAAANPDGGVGDTLDGNEQKIDLGKWLSMGAMEGTSSNSFGDQTLKLIGFASETRYVSTGMGEYLAGMLRLRANVSTTNKPIEGFITNRDMKRSLADEMVHARYIFTKRRSSGGFAIAAGDTAAYNIDDNRRSDFVRLTSVRIASAIIKAGRNLIDPYIGGPSNSYTISAIRSELQDMYELFVRDGYIKDDFEFQFIQDPNQAVLGHASLNQKVTPAFELRKVLSQMNLKK